MISITLTDTENAMPDLTFDFTWYKHARGYRLIEAKPMPRKRGQSLSDATFGDVQPARIVPIGGPLVPYRPLDEYDTLFEQFVREAKDEAGLLAFMNKFGPLTNDGLRKGGEVALEIIEEAKSMPGTVGAQLNPLRAAIVRANGRVRLKVSPACLLDALWLQFAEAQSKGAAFRQCENKKCGKMFVAGVRGDRRGDARFCSDKCRIQHNSHERSRR
jgi:hypothetical protein